MDLNGTWNGIPKKIAIPAGVVVIVGAYVFVKRYRASKAASAASTTTASGTAATATGGAGYGDPTGGLNVTLPESQAQETADTARYNTIQSQNAQITSALSDLNSYEYYNNRGINALLYGYRYPAGYDLASATPAAGHPFPSGMAGVTSNSPVAAVSPASPGTYTAGRVTGT